MKEKVLQVLKIVLIIFGVLFLLQVLIFFLIMLGLFSLGSAKTFDINTNFSTDKIKSASRPKEIQPVIDYAEDYQIKNKKYPENVENVKVKNNLDYKYEVTKDGNCYTVTVKEKNTTKQYQHCKTSSDNSSSTSESYVEYLKNER